MTMPEKKVEQPYDPIPAAGWYNQLSRTAMEAMGTKDPKEACTFLKTGVYKIVKKQRAWEQKFPGQITFTLKSEGTLGPDWKARLEEKNKNFKFSPDALSILYSREFHPTKDQEFEVIILHSLDHKWTTQDVMQKAKGIGLITPLPELACLIADKFSNQEILREMGLNSVHVMHLPITINPQSPGMTLSIENDGHTAGMDVELSEADITYGTKDGFAFLVRQPTLIKP